MPSDIVKYTNWMRHSTRRENRVSESRGGDSTDLSRRSFLGALGAGSVVALTRDPAHHASIIEEAVALQTSRGVRRDDYLFAPGLAYFGTATLGPCSRQVVEATTQAWRTLETNPTAMGYPGLTVGSPAAWAEETRQRAARLLGCAVDELVLTRSTTDGMNAIAQGVQLSPGDRVLTSDQEHPGGSMGWRHLTHRNGVLIDTIAIAPGENDPAAVLERLSQAIAPRTRVISISHVLSSTGLRMPIREIAELARSKGILCVVDGAQAVGGIEVDLKALGCHAYATSGHKWLMGPKGTGLLYISRDANQAIQPIQLEDGRAYYSESSGVGNIPGAVGLGVAIDALAGIGLAAVELHNIGLRNRIYEGLRELGRGGVVSPAPGPLATPLVTFELPRQVNAGTLARALRDKHNIQVKLVPEVWLSGIRLSPHVFNTEAEVARLMIALRAELG